MPDLTRSTIVSPSPPEQNLATVDLWAQIFVRNPSVAPDWAAYMGAVPSRLSFFTLTSGSVWGANGNVRGNVPVVGTGIANADGACDGQDFKPYVNSSPTVDGRQSVLQRNTMLFDMLFEDAGEQVGLVNANAFPDQGVNNIGWSVRANSSPAQIQLDTRLVAAGPITTTVIATRDSLFHRVTFSVEQRITGNPLVRIGYDGVEVMNSDSDGSLVNTLAIGTLFTPSVRNGIGTGRCWASAIRYLIEDVSQFPALSIS